MPNNPLFNMMGGNGQQFPFMQQLKQFQSTFQGDARSQVQQMLNSGRITQAQYDQAFQMASQIQKMMGK